MIVPPRPHGRHAARFWLSGIVALAVYILLHLAVNGLFRLFVVRKTEV